jgi:hypothetical protein
MGLCTRARIAALILSLLSLSELAAGQTPVAGPTNSYTVIYTGRLYGYFRYPALQEQEYYDQSKCPPNPDNDRNKPAPVTAFGDLINTVSAPGTTVRVAVGDNFAPYLLARQVWDAYKKRLIPKEDYYYLGKQLGWQSADYDNESFLNDPAWATEYRKQIEKIVNGQGTIPRDNVGCFLQLMNFNAIVPGEHDFYFGPDRLRQLARFLKKEPTRGSEYKQVRTLGANLSLLTRSVDPTEPLAAKENTPSASDQQPEETQNAQAYKTVVPQVVLPWLRSIRIKNALTVKVTQRVGEQNVPQLNGRQLLNHAKFECKEEKDFWNWLKQPLPGTPFQITDTSTAHYSFEFQKTIDAVRVALFELPASSQGTHPSSPSNAASPASIFVPGKDCKNPVTLVADLLPQTKEGHPDVDIEYGLPEGCLLKPDQGYVLKVEPRVDTSSGSTSKGKSAPQKEAKKKPDFWVQRPFFEDLEDPMHPNPALLPATDPSNKPWVLIPGKKGGVNVAVFGVVDPNMGQYVGRINDTWLSLKTAGGRYFVDNRHETDLQVSDPAEALQQALQYFEEVGKNDPACKSAHRILLAQMLQQDAYNLIGRLHLSQPFDLVIAQADPDRAAGERKTEKSYDAKKDDKREFDQPVVVVPGPHFNSDEPYSLHVRLQGVTVTNAVDADGIVRRSVDNKVYVNNQKIPVDPLKPLKAAFSVSPSSSFVSRVASLLVRQDKLLRDAACDESKGDPSCVDQGTPSQTNSFRKKRHAEDWSSLLRQWTTDQWSSFLEVLALKSMREACNSDVALLQHRDVFFPPEFAHDRPLNDEGIGALLDAVFWKGDYIKCMNLPGSTISSLMQTSKQLQDQENNNVVPDLSKGWPLVALGIGGQGSGQTINGQYLDPKKLYSVAMTDYLAYGDTGYPVLQGSEPYPAVPPSREILRLLRTYVAADLLPKKSKSERMADDEKEPVRGDEVMDALVKRPSPRPDPKPGFTDWLKGWPPSNALKSLGGAQQDVEELPKWSFNLYKADVSYSLFLHNGTEFSVGSQFPGVSTANLSNPDSATFIADYQARAQRDWQRWGFFAESDLNYGRKMQRGKPSSSALKAGPNVTYQVSQTADYWFHEVGFALRLEPDHQNPSGWTLQLPLGVQSQLAPPLTQLPLPPSTTGASAATAAPIVTGRNYYGTLRPALRYDYVHPRPPSPGQSPGQGQNPSGNLTSYVEFGYEGGNLFHGPSAFLFGSTSCSVSSLDACIQSLPSTATLTSVISGRRYFQQGFYLNFRIDMPLPRLPRYEFVGENRGDLFADAHGDSVVDTRLQNDTKFTLTVPIFRKVSLAPTLELFWFENKISNNLYFSDSTYVSLNYSFGWHSGLSLKKVLEGYTDPVPTLPSLPTR